MMTKSYIIIAIIVFLLLAFGPALWFMEQYKIQKTMNGIYNLKIFGQAILAYKEQYSSLPMDKDGTIFFSKLSLEKKSFKDNATPDIYQCKGVGKTKHLQGFGEKEVFAIGVSEKFFDPFSFSEYTIIMYILNDGSVLTEKKTLK